MMRAPMRWRTICLALLPACTPQTELALPMLGDARTLIVSASSESLTSVFVAEAGGGAEVLEYRHRDGERLALELTPLMPSDGNWYALVWAAGLAVLLLPGRARRAPIDRHHLVRYERHAVDARLLTTSPQEISRIESLMTQDAMHVRGEPVAWLSRVNDKHPAAGSAQCQGRREARRATPDDDHVPLLSHCTRVPLPRQCRPLVFSCSVRRST